MAKGSRGGRRGGAGGVNPSDILSTRDMIAERGIKQQEVDEALGVFRDFYNEYGTVVEQIQVAELKKGSNAMAYYDGVNIAVNQAYFDAKKLNNAFNDEMSKGFHPSTGNKTGMEALIAHEIGHKLTDQVGAKMGINGIGKIHQTSTAIVNEARKQTGHKGVVQMASKISEYATYSNAEAIAEAVSDFYCNGKKARKESIAIVNVINKYLK